MPITWGIAATVREPVEVVETFVAHHLVMGASRIVLYFDNPDDPAIARVTGLQGVEAVRCDAAHWAGGRPDTQEGRQKHNIRRAYAGARTDWLIHVDGDELVWSARPVAEILAAVAAETAVVRLAPAEVLARRRNPDVSVFRLPVPDTARGTRIGLAAYGAEFPLLRRGLLSHADGKYFLRTGLADLVPEIHAPRRKGRRCAFIEQDDIRLLHFHGQSEARWIAQVEDRLERGAYQHRHSDGRRASGKLDGRGLNAHLRHLRDTGGEAALRQFFRRVATYGPEKRHLAKVGAILRLRLWLPEKVATIFGRTAAVADLGQNPESGEIEGSVEFLGARLRIGLERNYTEIRLGLGVPDEAEELAAIEDLVRDRPVEFWDIGANAGIFSLVVAQAAGPGSTVTAFEPNPVMASRFRRNLSVIGGEGITLHEVALGPQDGTAVLAVPGNAGQASILAGSEGTRIEVPMRRLADYSPPRAEGMLRLLKIDIEGAEPLCLAPFFEATGRDEWPDVILYEHAHCDRWAVPPAGLFPSGFYREARRFAGNTLLIRGDRAV